MSVDHVEVDFAGVGLVTLVTPKSYIHTVITQVQTLPINVLPTPTHHQGYK